MSANDFRRIILTEIHAVLKPLGFRKKGALFSAERDEVVMFVQLQSSSKSTKDLLVVTVNLGIFSKIVAERLGNTRAPSIVEAHWQERIGFFLATPYDKWWDVHNEDVAFGCASEITNLLTEHALPEIQRLASTANLKSLWESGVSPGVGAYERKQFLHVLEKPSE
jgi:hypothetical protein